MTSVTNSPVQETPMRLEYRQSFSLNIVLNDSEGAPVSLLGCALSFSLAQPSHLGGANVLTRVLSLVDPVAGLARLNLQSDDLDVAVLGATEGEFPYIITLLTAENYSVVLMKGALEVLPNADPAVTADYGSVSPPLTLTATLRELHVVKQTVGTMPAIPTEPSSAYAKANPIATYVYNLDGSVSSAVEDGITTTYTYNIDGTVHTVTRNGVTRTYAYNFDGTVSGIS